jgi:hypothetical protein
VFRNPWPTFGRGVDRRGTTKSSAMEIMKYSPTGSRTLENADDQNAIAVLRPKSHINFYRVLSTWDDQHASTLATRDGSILFSIRMAGQT